MAGWMSVFEIGDCKVKLIVGNGGEGNEHEELLGLGNSFEFVSQSEETYTVSVSETGEVSVDGSNGYDGGYQEVQVIPQFDYAGLPSRLASVEFSELTGRAWGAVNFGAGGFVEFDSIFPASPNPMVLTDIPGDHDYMAIYAQPGLS